MDNYTKFLKNKQSTTLDSGFECDIENDYIFKFQKDIVKKALKKGRYAIFAETGLGKTLMQLVFANEVYKKEKKSVLILAPLAVSSQTIEEGSKFGIDVKKYSDSQHGILISNYEQLDNIDPSKFCGIVLDESSILKNFSGKIKNQIIEMFSNTLYKLACTATPSPNDLMELGNHSEFLNYMSRNEMLSMFFVHDGGDTSKWRLKRHSAKDFYSWIGSWASIVTSPSDLGFEDEGKKYKLPNLNYFEYEVENKKIKKGLLFNTTNVNAIDFNKELRDTMNLRLTKVKEILDSKPDESFLIWINQNEEGDKLKKLLSDYDFREVRGSDSVEKKEKDLLDFSNGKYRILITKGKIAGMGLNFQNCNNQIFASLDFSFEKLYQSVRRSYRFGQKNDVNIYLITVDSMGNVISTIKHKEKIFNELRSEMQRIINYEKKEYKKMVDNSQDYNSAKSKLLKGDCVQRIKEIESDSVGFSVFSPPFADLYTYSDSLEDMGNSKDWKEFMIHFGFLVTELYRVMKSGRNVAVHCMDLPIQKGKEGFIGLRDFSGLILRVFEESGFIYHSRITIWKDPVVEMQRTKALGLLHKQVKKDSTMSRVGIPDYVLVFRKDGERLDPVQNKNIPVDLWQKIASPVWMDINYGNTLQHRSARDDKDEKHICPLQLETIERLILLYSNKGDIVFTPFMGIASEVYKAIEMDRIGYGIELKDSYYKQALENVKQIEKTRKLF